MFQLKKVGWYATVLAVCVNSGLSLIASAGSMIDGNKVYITPSGDTARQLSLLLDGQVFEKDTQTNAWQEITSQATNRTKNRDFHFILDSKSLLLLGDGNKEDSSFTLAKKFSQVLPNDTQIVQADIQFPDAVEEKNVQQKEIDHTQEFPLDSNSFETIIMKKGLCCCNNTLRTCGGLDMSSLKDFTSFMGEVLRVMDQKNKTSVALLHGEIHKENPQIGQKQFQVISEVVSQYERKFPELRFYLIHTLHIDSQLALQDLSSRETTLKAQLKNSLFVTYASALLHELSRIQNKRQNIERNTGNYRFHSILITDKDSKQFPFQQTATRK